MFSYSGSLSFLFGVLGAFYAVLKKKLEHYYMMIFDIETLMVTNLENSEISENMDQGSIVARSVRDMLQTSEDLGIPHPLHETSFRRWLGLDNSGIRPPRFNFTHEGKDFRFEFVIDKHTLPNRMMLTISYVQPPRRPDDTIYQIQTSEITIESYIELLRGARDFVLGWRGPCYVCKTGLNLVKKSAGKICINCAFKKITENVMKKECAWP